MCRRHSTSLNCDVGEHEENGECVKDSPLSSQAKTFASEPCKEGFMRDSSGTCVEDTTSTALNEPCDPGFMRDSSGTCVEDTTLNMFNLNHVIQDL